MATLYEQWTGMAYSETADKGELKKLWQEYFLKEKNIPILSSEYGEAVVFNVFLTADSKARVCEELVQLTSGKVSFLSEEEHTFTV